MWKLGEYDRQLGFDVEFILITIRFVLVVPEAR